MWITIAGIITYNQQTTGDLERKELAMLDLGQTNQWLSILLKSIEYIGPSNLDLFFGFEAFHAVKRTKNDSSHGPTGSFSWSMWSVVSTTHALPPIRNLGWRCVYRRRMTMKRTCGGDAIGLNIMGCSAAFQNWFPKKHSVDCPRFQCLQSHV